MKIYFQQKHQTILFAVSELQRYVQAQIEVVTQWAELELMEEQWQIVMIDETSYKQFFDEKFTASLSNDCYTIIQDQQTYFIIAKNPRALLYGVYGFWQHILGLVSLEMGKPEMSIEKSTLYEKLDRIITHEPLFNRRGNVLETINDAEFVSALIDWGVKNGHNETFFTFFLWDEIKEKIEILLTERAVDVTLGGHSLRYIIAQCIVQKDSFSSQALEGAVGDLIGDQYTLPTDYSITNKNFFEQGNHLQQLVIGYIVKTCQQTSVIKRISLWPEDVGIEKSEAKHFLQLYIQFTDNLQQALKNARLEVQVEHIVYNAGLKWEMLERGETKPSVTSDVLYAYWGRNYEVPFGETEACNRAFKALQDWRNETANRLTMFEYYSDHYMLSELFPPLISRVREDMLFYHSLNCDGVINLIVPLHKQSQLQWLTYNWRWNQHINNVIYSRLTWGEPYELILTYYFNQFGDRAEYYKQLIFSLEQHLAPISKWNRVLFPYRVVDLQQIKTFDNALQIANQLKKVIHLLTPLNYQKGQNDTEEHMIGYLKDLQKIATQLEKEWRMKVTVSN